MANGKDYHSARKAKALAAKPPSKALVKPQAHTGLYVRGSKGLRLRDQRVRLLSRRMFAVMGWLEESDAPAVRAWCELEVLCNRAYAEIRERGLINAKGEVLRLVTDYRQLRATQIVLSRELGLTPSARAMLKTAGAKQPSDLASLMSANAEDVAEEKGNT